MALMEYRKSLPKGVPTCSDQQDRAHGFVGILYSGHTYWLPITKEMKRLFGISLRAGNIVFKKDDDKYDFEKAVREIVHAVYLQIRDTVGSEIEQALMTEIRDGFSQMLFKQVADRVDASLTKALPPPQKIGPGGS